MSVKLATPSEITAEDHALSELSTLTEHRRTRLLQRSSPPASLGVSSLGGFLTIASASMFGSAYDTPGLPILFLAPQRERSTRICG